MRSRSMISTIALGSALVLAAATSASAFGGGHAGGMGGGHAMAGGHMGGMGAGGISGGGSFGRGPASFAGGARGDHNRGGFGGGGYGYGLYDGYDAGYADPGYDYGEPDYAEGPEDGAVLTGRSAARVGGTCSTPVTTCALYRESYIGQSCSCGVPGGYAGGRVTR